LDDQFYIQKVIEGDSEAYRFLIDRYKDKAFSVAFSVLHNQSIIEDVVQEAFIKAFRKLSSFRGESNFSTWLMRIVVNESIKVLRKNKLKRAFVNQSDNIDIHELNSSLEAIKQEEQKKYIELVLSQIPHREALILQLYYLNDYSVKEIEEIIQIKPEHIKVLLFRARKLFYSILQHELKHELKSLV